MPAQTLLRKRRAAAEFFHPPGGRTTYLVGALCRHALAAAVTALCAAASWAAQAGPAPALETWTYRVQRGEHLFGIAQKMLAEPHDWRRLQRLNRITAPRRLQPGQAVQLPVAWLRGDAAQAEVTQVVGQVLVRGGAARDGNLLSAQDTLETRADSSAMLRFADGSQLRVSPASRITLEQAQVLRGSGQAVQVMRLQQGEVESQVRREPPRPRFEIRSPVLRLGARGTEFRAAFDGASRTGQAAVDQGHVEARSDQPADKTPGTLLSDGFGVTATAQGLSRPLELLPAAPLATTSLIIERLPVRLRWTALTSAVPVGSPWQAQVLASTGDAGRPAPLVAERRGSEAEVDFGALPDGRYRLRLRAVDAQGLAGREAALAFVVAARPEPPFLSAPARDAVLVGARAPLAWARSSAAARYRLQIAASADFAAPTQDLRDLEATEASIELAPGRWFWRLAGVRADGHQGPWSDVQTFEQRSDPPPAAPSAPGAQTGSDGALRFRFSAGQPGDRYEFQLAGLADGTSSFDKPLLERHSATPELLLDGLEPGTYQLRARVIDARGVAGPWGPSGSFEVPRASAWWWLPALVLLLLI